MSGLFGTDWTNSLKAQETNSFRIVVAAVGSEPSVVALDGLEPTPLATRAN